MWFLCVRIILTFHLKSNLSQILKEILLITVQALFLLNITKSLGKWTNAHFDEAFCCALGLRDSSGFSQPLKGSLRALAPKQGGTMVKVKQSIKGAATLDRRATANAKMTRSICHWWDSRMFSHRPQKGADMKLMLVCMFRTDGSSEKQPLISVLQSEASK